MCSCFLYFCTPSGMLLNEKHFHLAYVFTHVTASQCVFIFKHHSVDVFKWNFWMLKSCKGIFSCIFFLTMVTSTVGLVIYEYVCETICMNVSLCMRAQPTLVCIFVCDYLCCVFCICECVHVCVSYEYRIVWVFVSLCEVWK